MQQRALLIIVSGLLRTYRETWPVLSAQLQLDHLERRGDMRTHVAVLTDFSTSCSAKTLELGHCPIEWEKLDPVQTYRDLKEVYGKRLRFVMDLTLRFKDSNGARGLDRRVERFQGAMTQRLRIPRLSTQLYDPYDAVLVVRPDIVFVQPSVNRLHGFSALSVLRLCADNPGVRLIGGSVKRPYFFHTRDWDYAWLVCPPASVINWLLLDANDGDKCSAWHGCSLTPPQPPPQPRHINGDWNSTQHEKKNMCTVPDHSRILCDRVLYFHRRRIPFDALPEELLLAHIVRLQVANGTMVRRPVPCTIEREEGGGLLTPAGSRAEERACKPYALPIVTGVLEGHEGRVPRAKSKGLASQLGKAFVSLNPFGR
jgi:hypothetical protein